MATQSALPGPTCIKFNGDRSKFRSFLSQLTNVLLSHAVMDVVEGKADIYQKPEALSEHDSSDSKKRAIFNHKHTLYEKYREKTQKAYGLIRSYLTDDIADICSINNLALDPKKAMENLKEAFELDPKKHDHRRALETEIENFRMKPGEQFHSWYSGFATLALRVEMSLTEKQKYFDKRGYLLEHLSTQWTSCCIDQLDWESSIEKLRICDSIFHSKREEDSTKKKISKTSFRGEGDEEDRVEDRGKTPYPRRPDEFKKRCFNCDNFGHVVEECRTKFCNFCKRYGKALTHAPADCRNRYRNRGDAPADTKTPGQEQKKSFKSQGAKAGPEVKKSVEFFQKKKRQRQVRIKGFDYGSEGEEAGEEGEDSEYDEGRGEDDDEDEVRGDRPCSFSQLGIFAEDQDDEEEDTAYGGKRGKIHMIQKKRVIEEVQGQVQVEDKTEGKRFCLTDSGAESHTVPDKGWLTRQYSRRVVGLETATSEPLTVEAMGDISDVITDVAVCPQIEEGLIATLPLQKKGYTVMLIPLHVHPEVGAIYYDSEMKPVMIADHNLKVDMDMTQDDVDSIFEDDRLAPYRSKSKRVRRIKGESSADRSMANLCKLVHEALGHATIETMCRIADGKMIEDFPLKSDQIRRHFLPCLACVRGKWHRASLKTAHRTSSSSPETPPKPGAFADKLCSDIYGPLPHASGGKAFAISYTADPGGYVSVFMVNAKSDLLATLKEVLEDYRKAGRHSSSPVSPISILQSDSESVYMDKEVEKVLKANGIKHQASTPYVHEQNGVAERMHRTIGDLVATFYAAAPWLPREFWPYAVRHAAFCLNLHPRRYCTKTPYEEFTGKRPSFTVHPLLPFGQAVEIFVPLPIRSWKGAPHTALGAYLGPALKSKKAIRALHMDTKRVVTTNTYWIHPDMPLMRQFQFDIGPMFINEDFEEAPPVLPGGDGGADGGEHPGLQGGHPEAAIVGGGVDGGVDGGVVGVMDVVDRGVDRGMDRGVGVGGGSVDDDGVSEWIVGGVGVGGDGSRGGELDGGRTGVGVDGRLTPGGSTGVVLTVPLSDSNVPQAENLASAPKVQGASLAQTDWPSNVPQSSAVRPERAQALPAVPGQVKKAYPPLPTKTSLDNSLNTYNTRSKMIAAIHAAEEEEACGKAFQNLLKVVLKINKVVKGEDTPSMKQALQSKDSSKWKEAINKELQQLRDMEVYSLVDSFPPWARPVRTHFVLKASRDAAGIIYKYKARLVCQGNRQDPSTFDLIQSPTARSAAVRLLVAIAVHRGRRVEAFDIPGAYLNSETATAKSTQGDPNLYIILPDGTKGKLDKFLYGLKQSGLEWHHTIKEFLFNLNYTQSPAEPCLFVWREDEVAEGSAFGDGERFHILVIYVDDFLAFGSDDEIQDRFYALLRHRFGDVPRKQGNFTFLSIEIKQFEDGSATLSMPGYCRKMIEQYKMQDSKPVSNPDRSGRTPQDERPGDQEQFMRMLGSLMYLACSVRFDLLCVLSRLAAKSRAPTEGDNSAIRRVLRYVKGTQDLGITFRPSDDVRLTCKVDASFDSEPMSRSRSGMMFSLGPDAPAFHAKSTKQVMIAQSSTEAEYIALYEALLEIIWLRYLLADMGYPQSGPTTVFEDNSSCIQIAEGAGAQQRTKHFVRRLHYTRQAKDDGLIEIHHLNTDRMTADLLTKALPDQDFRRHCLSLLGK